MDNPNRYPTEEIKVGPYGELPVYEGHVPTDQELDAVQNDQLTDEIVAPDGAAMKIAAFKAAAEQAERDGLTKDRPSDDAREPWITAS